MLAGLWSGETFSYNGQYYNVKEAQFLPKPVQSPRIPTWVAGFWPRKGPFNRAARWDGVFPGKLGLGGDELMPLEDLRAIVSYVSEQRESKQPFDVVLLGSTTGEERERYAEIFAEYASEGLTWRLEGIHGWRAPFEERRYR